MRDTTVQLVRVADVAARAAALRGARRATGARCGARCETTVYDGASNLGAVRHDGVSQEALWFSDGLANYGAPWRLAFPVPVYAITSAASSDPAALQALADATGGRSIDLASATRQGAADALLAGAARWSGWTRSARAISSSSRRACAAGRLVVAGVLSADEAPR